jgi:hypothetical protein
MGAKRVAATEQRMLAITAAISLALIAVLTSVAIISSPFVEHGAQVVIPTSTPTITPSPTPFDPNVGAPLPNNRVVAYYGIPGAEPSGPAFELTTAMLARLKQTGNAYAALDPTHPVQLGIDLVANVADGFPGPSGTYDHNVDNATIQQYIDFCQQNNLLLFFDLEFGRAPIQATVKSFLPYLERYPFAELALDPEWAFPPYNPGIPGVNVGSLSATDINAIIGQMAAIPMQYHVPRKVLVIHEFRPEVLIHKEQIKADPLVSIVLHVDSVGDFPGASAEKIQQYAEWVKQQPIQYGGFKLFYNLETPYHLMTPKEVMALDPPPLVITYGN